MRSKQIVLELLPSRIDVVLYVGGRRAGGERIAIGPDSDIADWLRSLRRATAALESEVSKLGAAGVEATVVYQSPTQSSGLITLEVKPLEAADAARLQCLDSLPYPAESAVCEAVLAERTPKACHVLVAAERDDVAQAIAELVEEAGLTFKSATPVSAAILAGELDTVLRAGKGLTARLYVGEQNSYFFVAEGGSLVFDRQIRIGLDAIASSLTRPIALDDGERITLDESAARQIVHQHGRPDWKQVVHEQLGLTGAQIAPLMQPILQRLIIELRQSLRFGMSEAQREKLAITLLGPGSGMPGLAALIASELRVEVAPDPAYGAYDWQEPGCPGSELVDAFKQRRVLSRLNLLSRQLTCRRDTSRFRRWMWTGAAVALAVIGVDAARYHMRLTEARKVSRSLEAQAASQEAQRNTIVRLTSISGAMAELERTIAAEMDDRPSYAAVMQEFSLLTPPIVRLTSLGLGGPSDPARGVINGFVFLQQGDSRGTQLEQYVKQLSASPLIANVTLGDVNMGELGGFTGERFSVSFSCAARRRCRWCWAAIRWRSCRDHHRQPRLDRADHDRARGQHWRLDDARGAADAGDRVPRSRDAYASERRDGRRRAALSGRGRPDGGDSKAAEGDRGPQRDRG